MLQVIKPFLRKIKLHLIYWRGPRRLNMKLEDIEQRIRMNLMIQTGGFILFCLVMMANPEFFQGVFLGLMIFGLAVILFLWAVIFCG